MTRMKKIFLVLVIFLVPSIARADMKHRIWYMPDGTVSVTIPAPKACMENELPADCEKRIFEEIANEIPELKAVLDSGDYKDIDSALKPDRKDRKYWRGTKVTGIVIDTAAKNADNQERLKRKADKNAAKGKLRGLGLTNDEIESLLEK